MEITGTIEDPDGGHERISASGDSYEQAKAALEEAIPEGHRLIAIRTF